MTSALKRIAGNIFEKGGVIRKLENLGTRDMPYKTSVHGVVYRQARYLNLYYRTVRKLIYYILVTF